MALDLVDDRHYNEVIFFLVGWSAQIGRCSLVDVYISFDIICSLLHLFVKMRGDIPTCFSYVFVENLL